MLLVLVVRRGGNPTKSSMCVVFETNRTCIYNGDITYTELRSCDWQCSSSVRAVRAVQVRDAYCIITRYKAFDI